MNVVPFEQGERTIIRVGADVHRVIDEAAETLTAHSGVYQRDGQLVQVLEAPEDEHFVLPGSPVVRAVPLSILRSMLSSVATYEKFNAKEKKWVKCMPPDAVTRGVLDLGRWTGVRNLVGVVEAPAFRPDGSILSQPGYDARTGYVYTPSDQFPTVAERPTIEDATKARAELEEVFCDFPFDSPASRAVPLAALLTLLARPAIAGCTPGFVKTANTRGSGKTLTADVVSLIATGRIALAPIRGQSLKLIPCTLHPSFLQQT